MRDDLLLYYERELSFLREMGAEFAEKYPKIASPPAARAGQKCEDPHVERLLEAFAFLAARVHLKIDDDFPEITEALLSIALSAPPPADPVDVHRGVPGGPGTGQADTASSIPRGLGALLAAGGRRAVQVPHLLRHHPLADIGRRRGMEDSGPAAAAPSKRRSRRPRCASNCAARPT